MVCPVSQPSLAGVYLLLDERWASNLNLCRVLELAAGCGIRLCQYRNKTGSIHDVVARARALRDVASRYGVLFIVNDRCDVALATGADGVHLGQEDLPLDLARRVMGRDKIIGISTHRPEDVEAATRGGADYIGYGPIFSSTTKDAQEPLVGLDGLRAIRSLTPLPVFAIGGMTPSSVRRILDAGADGVAVASAVLDAPMMEQTMRGFVNQFPAPSSPQPESSNPEPAC